jgi:hypothetical protein
VPRYCSIHGCEFVNHDTTSSWFDTVDHNNLPPIFPLEPPCHSARLWEALKKGQGPCISPSNSFQCFGLGSC